MNLPSRKSEKQLDSAASRVPASGSWGGVDGASPTEASPLAALGEGAAAAGQGSAALASSPVKDSASAAGASSGAALHGSSPAATTPWKSIVAAASGVSSTPAATPDASSHEPHPPAGRSQKDAAATMLSAKEFPSLGEEPPPREQKASDDAGRRPRSKSSSYYLCGWGLIEGEMK